MNCFKHKGSAMSCVHPPPKSHGHELYLEELKDPLRLRTIHPRATAPLIILRKGKGYLMQPMASHAHANLIRKTTDQPLAKVMTIPLFLYSYVEILVMTSNFPFKFLPLNHLNRLIMNIPNPPL